MCSAHCLPLLCHLQLVLPDRLAVDAARAVSAYLLQHSVPDKQLYSLHDAGRGAFRFAYEYAAQCSTLISIWQHEQKQATERVQKRWAEVQRKQQLAAQLRITEASLQQQISNLQPDITKLQVEQQSIQCQLSDVTSQLNNLHRHSVSYQTVKRPGLTSQQSQLQQQNATVNGKLRPLQQKQAALQSSLSSTRCQLKEAEAAPAAIIQPLPHDRRTALQWLFLLHTPAVLRCLSRCSFLAQQLLLPLPCSPTVATSIQLRGLATSLADHYNNHQRSSYHTVPLQYTAAKYPVSFWSESAPPNLQDVGPKHVDHITSAEVGVWYPDSLAPAMAWSGSGTAADRPLGLPSGLFNPFVQVSQQLIAENFTERLPASYSSLQWAMLQVGSRAATPAERGNQGIARQDDKPSWLSKPGYLALTSLRAYPLSQLQRLCCALREQVLPLGHPVVLTMVKQSVMQIGEVVQATAGNSSSSSSSQLIVSSGGSGTSSSGTVQLLWRTDWQQEGGSLAALGFELQQLASQLAEAPREHDAVLLLGQLAAYLADYSDVCKDAAKQFAEMTSRAANQLQPQVEAAAQQNQEKVAVQLQAKQSKARAVSLLCYGAGPLDAADVGRMLQLIVLVKHGDLFASTAAGSIAGELPALRVQCRQVMARRLPAVLAVLQEQPALLTAAVSGVLQRAPPKLQWQQLPGSSNSSSMMASFQAVGSDGHLYSINILDGTVLLDGVPPGRLPNDVLQHPLYHRTFGSCNFEVVVTQAGVRQTLRPINGRFYDFYWSSAKAAASSAGSGSSGRLLVIEELEQATGDRLQLLDVGEDGSCGTWGGQLPVMLQQLYSHWYHRWGQDAACSSNTVAGSNCQFT
jgi:hypothetical protein